MHKSKEPFSKIYKNFRKSKKSKSLNLKTPFNNKKMILSKEAQENPTSNLKI